MATSEHTITIRDVTPRDGLQSEAPVPPTARAELALALAAAGVAHVEAVSFVSPRAVPAMAGADAVVAALDEHPGVDATWWALVPNARGAELAAAAGIGHLTVTVSASDGYSEKNVGTSTADAITGLGGIVSSAGSDTMLDIVVSCAFGSPFDDVSDAGDVADAVAAIVDQAPTARITLADTTGTATPRRIAEVLRAVGDVVPADAVTDLGLHLHDTRGTALANALSAIDLGITRFDTAVGGLGGSPFAPGAGGNLATEDLVLVLHDLGIATGIDLDAVIAIAGRLNDLVGHPVPGRVAGAGPLSRFGRR